ncbi:pilus assembly protein TadG-related protein [Streptomyces murinus]|uniref:pilus assembly protein TadG-related protein n=1 Tax=Streptomyces murinus TaxID=33900 RepID=UPI0033ED72A3
MTRPVRDAGQAFPIYLTVVAGLLFLALAYLAVGQAAVNRGGAQTAADAAALAAAQDVRDQLTGQWLKVLLDPAQWQAVLDGAAPLDDDPCGRAGELAGQNDARLTGCAPAGPLRYRAEVRTDKSVGHSVVPGTEKFRSTASATAEIEPLCTFALPPKGAGDAPAHGAAKPELPRLTCKDKVWDLDPDDPSGLPGPEDLFDVHLAD